MRPISSFIRFLFLLFMSLGWCSSAFSKSMEMSFEGWVSDVVYSNALVEQGDPVVGVLKIDTAAPNWYGDDPDWGAYEANVVLSYGSVQIDSLISLYIDVRGREFFGVARVPVDEDGLVYTDFRFWVQLRDVTSTSLPKALESIGDRGAAALLTFDASETRVQCFAQDIKVTVSPVPEPSTAWLSLVGMLIVYGAHARRTAPRRR